MSQIQRGLCVLVGLTHDDTPDDVDYIARKLLALRLFEDDAGKQWARGVRDCGLDMLCVSQFTLYARLKGNKPDYHMAMGGAKAQPLYNSLLAQLRTALTEERVKDGVFGAEMRVSICNDGPVTIVLDSNARDPGQLVCHHGRENDAKS